MNRLTSAIARKALTLIATILTAAIAIISVSIVAPKAAQAVENGGIPNPTISMLSFVSNGSPVSESPTVSSNSDHFSTYKVASNTTKLYFTVNSPSDANATFTVPFFQVAGLSHSYDTVSQAPSGDSTGCSSSMAEGNGPCGGTLDGSGRATFTVNVSGVSSSSSLKFQLNGATAKASMYAGIEFNGTATGPAPTGSPTPSPSPTSTPSRIPATPLYLTFGADDTRGNATGERAFEGASASVGTSVGGRTDRALKLIKTGAAWSGINILQGETTMRIGGEAAVSFDFYSPDSTNTPVLVKLDGAGYSQKVATAVPGWSRISIDLSTASGYSASANYPTLAIFPNYDSSPGSGGAITNTGQAYYIDNVSVNGGVLADGALDDRSAPLPSPTATPTSTSTPSPTPTPTFPAVPASAPSITSAVTGSGRATLSIAAPSVLGDTALTGYDYSTNNGSTWSHFASVDGPFAITGLTNGTAYQVKVRAVNSAGPGAASDAVTVTPTNLVPAVPTITSVTAGNQMADVSIAQATGVTAQSVTGYQYNINGSLSWASCVMTSQTCRVTGLPNGAKATIKVRAVNANGVSLASAKSYVTPVTTSQSPTINSITSSAGALTVAFTAPVDNGGSKVLRYEYSVDGGSWVNPVKPIAKSPFKVSGLANATSYAMRVRAVTAVGIGEVSSSVSGTTPAVVASAPSITTALAGKTSITVNFTAPTNNGGAAVTNYAYTVDGKTWTTLSPASASIQIVISGLTSYKAYTVKLRAINSAGLGAISASQSVKTLK